MTEGVVGGSRALLCSTSFLELVMVYMDDLKREFRHNDVVKCTCVLLPREQAVGRLLQVRRGKGQFGSDIYLIRLADGSLRSFENVGLEHAIDSVPLNADDTTDVEYTIRGKFPESGFIIEEPRQPASPSPVFCVTISRG